MIQSFPAFNHMQSGFVFESSSYIPYRSNELDTLVPKLGPFLPCSSERSA